MILLDLQFVYVEDRYAMVYAVWKIIGYLWRHLSISCELIFLDGYLLMGHVELPLIGVWLLSCWKQASLCDFMMHTMHCWCVSFRFCVPSRKDDVLILLVVCLSILCLHDQWCILVVVARVKFCVHESLSLVIRGNVSMTIDSDGWLPLLRIKCSNAQILLQHHKFLQIS